VCVEKALSDLSFHFRFRFCRCNQMQPVSQAAAVAIVSPLFSPIQLTDWQSSSFQAALLMPFCECWIWRLFDYGFLARINQIT